MAHAFYSPSHSHMWGHCYAALTYPENQPQPETFFNKYADDGTATHHWAGIKLKGKIIKVGDTFKLNNVTYTLDEERLDRIIRYKDWVEVICGGPPMFVEHHVDMRPLIDTDGTCDAGHIMKLQWGWEVIALDLKDGSGERVDAKANFQGLNYCVGLYNDAISMGYRIKGARVGICQPKLGTYDIWPPLDQPPLPVDDLLAFAKQMQAAIDRTEEAMVSGDPQKFAVPFDDKTCRWCKVQHKCEALRLKLERIVGDEFEVVSMGSPPAAPQDSAKLSEAFAAIPTLKRWMAAVTKEMWSRLNAGESILGPDGQPYKFIEGKKGNRTWKDPKAAEADLVGLLSPDKLYVPARIIDPPAADKLLNRKGTKDFWEDIAEKHIDRKDGKPAIALGSDKRPPFNGAATADDFELSPEDDE